jgi:hypothetical protein
MPIADEFQRGWEGVAPAEQPVEIPRGHPKQRHRLDPEEDFISRSPTAMRDLVGHNSVQAAKTAWIGNHNRNPSIWNLDWVGTLPLRILHPNGP